MTGCQHSNREPKPPMHGKYGLSLCCSAFNACQLNYARSRLRSTKRIRGNERLTSTYAGIVNHPIVSKIAVLTMNGAQSDSVLQMSVGERKLSPNLHLQGISSLRNCRNFEYAVQLLSSVLGGEMGVKVNSILPLMLICLRSYFRHESLNIVVQASSSMIHGHPLHFSAFKLSSSIHIILSRIFFPAQ
jgi:hypothetical protein